MNVRAAQPFDIPDIIAIEHSCENAAHWSEAEYTNMFIADAVPRLALVADDAKLAGFVIARTAGPEWEIENVAVMADRRRRGVGILLVKAVIDRAIGHHIHKIHLEVRASNHAARALYARAGFHVSGVRPAYYEQPAEDAVLYSWEWLPTAP